MKSLVIVDDNVDQLELMVMAIRHLDLDRAVVTFDSGAECLDSLKCGIVVPGLIVIDVNMPGDDGPSTARRIRELGGAMSTVPIVMLSTSDHCLDRANSDAAGADAYVLKPMVARRWVDVVLDVMEHWKDE